MDGRDDDVRDSDEFGGFGEEGEEGDVFAVGLVVRLVVEDDAGFMVVVVREGRHRFVPRLLPSSTSLCCHRATISIFLAADLNLAATNVPLIG